MHLELQPPHEVTTPHCLVLLVLMILSRLQGYQGKFQGLQAGPVNEVYVLMNKAGTQVHLVPGGASIQRIITADRNGRFTDVALGFDDAASYNDFNSNGPKFGVPQARRDHGDSR